MCIGMAMTQFQVSIGYMQWSIEICQIHLFMVNLSLLGNRVEIHGELRLAKKYFKNSVKSDDEKALGLRKINMFG